MPKATKKSIKVRLLHAEKTGAAAVENAEDLYSRCPLCNKEVDDCDYRRELDCDSAMCPPRLYHEDCITNHLSKHRFMRDRNNGFRCPAVLTNGKPCPAYVYKVHIMQPQNKKKKEKKLEALLEAPPPRPPKPPPAPAKAPAAATVVAGVTAGTKGTAQAKPTVLKVINSNAPVPVRPPAGAKAAAAGPGARIHASNTPSDIPGLDPAVKRNAELRALAAKLRAEIPANNSKAGAKADPGSGGMAGAVKGAGGEGAAWGKGPTAAQRAAWAESGGGCGGGDGWEVVRRGHKAVAHGEHHGNAAGRALDAHGAFAMGASDFPALMAAEPPDRHTPNTDLSYDDDVAEIANIDYGNTDLVDTEQQQPDSAFDSESDAAFAGESAVLYDTPGPAIDAVLYDIVYSGEDGSVLVLNDVLQMYVRPEDVYGNDLLTVECAGDDGNTYTCIAVTEAQMQRRNEWVVQQLALQEQELEQHRQQQEQLEREQQEQAAREEAERLEQERLRLEREQQERLRLEQEQRERERQEQLRRQQEAEAAAAAAAAALAAQQQRQREEEEERQRRQLQLQREQQAAAAAAEAQQRAAEATAAAAAAAEAQRRAQEAAQLAAAPPQPSMLQAAFAMPQSAAPAMLPYTLSGPHPTLPPYHMQHQHTTAQLQPPLPPYLMAQQQQQQKQHAVFPPQHQPVQAAAAAAMPQLQGVPVFPGAAPAPAPVPRPQPAPTAVPTPMPVPVPVPQPVPVSAQPGAFPYGQQPYHAFGAQQQQQVAAEEEDDEVSSLMQLLCT